MPFKSKKQETYLKINEPKIYKEWKKRYGTFKSDTLDNKNEQSKYMAQDKTGYEIPTDDNGSFYMQVRGDKETIQKAFKDWKPKAYPYEKRITQDSLNITCENCGEEKVHYQFYLPQKNSRYGRMRFVDGATYCKYDEGNCGANLCSDCADDNDCENCGAEMCSNCADESEYTDNHKICVPCREADEMNAETFDPSDDGMMMKNVRLRIDEEGTQFTPTWAIEKKIPVLYHYDDSSDLEGIVEDMGDVAERYAKEHNDAYRFGAETFEAPYAGLGSLFGFGQDTGLGSFTTSELTGSSAIHGDFDSASLNYSGHQNFEVRAEETVLPPSIFSVKIGKNTWSKGDKRIRGFVVEYVIQERFMENGIVHTLAPETKYFFIKEEHFISKGKPFLTFEDVEWSAENEMKNVEFEDWAKQEMKTHGKDVSFKNWAKKEEKSHGNVELMDWAEHEEESHDERYGADMKTYEAYDDKISERQEYLIEKLGGNSNSDMTRSQASDLIKKLQGKRSGTWRAEEPMVEEPDFIPDGDGRALGQQTSSINLSPLHSESKLFNKTNALIAGVVGIGLWKGKEILDMTMASLKRSAEEKRKGKACGSCNSQGSIRKTHTQVKNSEYSVDQVNPVEVQGQSDIHGAEGVTNPRHSPSSEPFGYPSKSLKMW